MDGGIGVLAVALFPFEFLDAQCCGLESAKETRLVLQAVVEIGAPEIGQIGVVIAAEGCPVGAGRGHDQGAVVGQGVDEPTRIADRDDDHLPANSPS